MIGRLTLMLSLLTLPALAAERMRIPEIQGRSHESSVRGEMVVVEGVVSHLVSNGFFIRDEVGDNDDATSDGILVRRVGTGLAVGDRVRVEGIVAEFNSGGFNVRSDTVIDDPVFLKLNSGALMPPVIIGGAGRLPPTELIAAASEFDPITSGADFWESLEGMVVRIERPIVVGPTDDRKQFYIVAEGGDGATGMNSLGGITSTPGDLNPERIRVQVQAPLNETDFQLAVGDRFAAIEGAVVFDGGGYELRPAKAEGFTAAQSTPTPIGAAPEEDVLTIAGYNVRNFDPIVENAAKAPLDGVDDDSGNVQAIARQIVDLLGSPDILALQEVQDNDGGEYSDVVAADRTLKAVTDAISTAGGPAYQPLSLNPIDDAVGGQPGGNIRVAFLFNPARVSVDPANAKRIEGAPFARTRLPLAAPFNFRGKEIIVINVHLSSKGGSDSPYGPIQPPRDPAGQARLGQTRTVREFIRNLPPDPNRGVVVVGDFNAFWYEESMLVFSGGEPILTNLAMASEPLERISYVFEGNSQSLDHALVLLGEGQSATVDTLHMNSRQPFSRQISDHDPKLVRIKVE